MDMIVALLSERQSSADGFPVSPETEKMKSLEDNEFVSHCSNTFHC